MGHCLDVGKGCQKQIDRYKDGQKYQGDWKVNNQEADMVDLLEGLVVVLE